MTPQRFDPASLLLGLVAIAIGVAALIGRLGELMNRPAAALPLAIGVLGLAVIASARRPASTRRR
jgi:hypothetical protein